MSDSFEIEQRQLQTNIQPIATASRADMIESGCVPKCVDINGQQHSRQIFEPPLSIQRYQWVHEFVRDNLEVKSVTDVGCGNGRLINWLKTVKHLELLNFVDINNLTLEAELHNYFRPGLCEMLFGRQNSTERLDIKIYHGDLTIPDSRLVADCFIMVEVIEHMLPGHVEQSARTIFGYYQPKFVIITTPNSEFNHLLRAEGEPDDKFRHDDHKFEWTRAQFVHWCQEVCRHHSYSVSFGGVGHLPGSHPFGPCTQIATFRRSSDHKPTREELDPFCSALGKLNFQDDVSDGYYWTATNLSQAKIRLMAEHVLPGRKVDLSSSINNSTSPDTPFSWTD